MPQLRISATELESFRLYLEEEWFTHEKILSQLRGEGEETIKMRAGTAWHQLLEDSDASVVDGEVESEGFMFLVDIDGDLALPEIREIKVERDFRIGGLDVTLVAKADALSGKTVQDHKLTGEFDAEKYQDSLQWRTYLYLFDCDTFIYNVFEGSEVVREKVVKKYPDHTPWKVDGFHRLTCHRYRGIERDVFHMLVLLVEFIKECVPERIDAPSVLERKLGF